MSHWPSSKATKVLAALLRIGWRVKCQSGSHRTLSREVCLILPFTIAMRSGQECLLGSRNTLVSLLRTSDRGDGLRVFDLPALHRDRSTCCWSCRPSERACVWLLMTPSSRSTSPIQSFPANKPVFVSDAKASARERGAAPACALIETQLPFPCCRNSGNHASSSHRPHSWVTLHPGYDL